MKQRKNSSQTWPVILFTIGVFMAGLDNGIISTALTTINESFRVSPSWGAWSITIYTLGVAISVPIIGKLSDRYGRRRLFIIEITLFGLGSLFVALSPNFVSLLIARFIQAIGGGGIFIIGSSHILATLPKERQGRALGILGSMHGISAIIGPNLGAFILSLTGTWQWMFLINLPIALFLVIFGYLKIPETKAGKTKPLDFQGIVLLSGGILAMMVGFTQLDQSGATGSILDLRILLFIVFGLTLLSILMHHERKLEARKGDPILPYSLLSQGNFQLVLFLGLLSGGFLAGIIFIPSYVQQVLLVPVEKAGFWVTPLALASGIGAGLGGFLTDRYGPVRTIVFSGLIGGGGFLLFPFWVNELWMFVIASILAGIGLGILLGAPLNVLVGGSAGHDRQGSALGTLSLSRQIGLSLFPALYAGLIAGGVNRVEPTMKRYYEDESLAFDPPEDASSEEVFFSIMEEIETIPDQQLQTHLIETISKIIKVGYHQMFIVASILSLFVVISGILLLIRRSR